MRENHLQMLRDSKHVTVTLHFDPELEAQVLEEAAPQGVTIDKYLSQLIKQRTQSAPQASTYKQKKECLLEVAKKWHRMPMLNNRTPDEIIGYDEFGLPAK